MNRILLFCRRLSEWLSDVNPPGPGEPSRAERALKLIVDGMGAAGFAALEATVMGEADETTLRMRERFVAATPTTEEVPVVPWEQAFPVSDEPPPVAEKPGEPPIKEPER